MRLIDDSSFRSGDLTDLDQLNLVLRPVLPDYLRQRRWFGDKGRRIDDAAVIASFPIDENGSSAALLIIHVQFDGGQPARYVLPVSFKATSELTGESLTRYEIGEVPGYLVDALEDARVHRWLIGFIRSGSTIESGGLELRADRPADAEEVLDQAVRAPTRALGVEQSNSAIVAEGAAFIKLFRRLQFGVNPDVEVTRFLSSRAGYNKTPRYLGSIDVTNGGATTTLLIAQELVENVADGWSHFQDLLRSAATDASFESVLVQSRALSGRLGEVTAEMHLALASDPWDSEFAPEPIEDPDIARWTTGYLNMLESVIESVQNLPSDATGTNNELVVTFLTISEGLRRRTIGFETLRGRWKTRVHGDYHLGQTLRTRDDFAIIDFEGEPQRTIAERRAKVSPLKDVAGMLRSFAYAKGELSTLRPLESAPGPGDLIRWEREARKSFLAAYRIRIDMRESRLIPESDADFEAAVEAWELDKALYEVQYEVNNRPDWLWIPLSALIKRGEPA